MSVMIINSLKQSGSYCKMHVFVTVKESAININWSTLMGVSAEIHWDPKCTSSTEH